MKEIYLGTGDLNWRRFERVSDRYGTVGLWQDEGTHLSLDEEGLEQLVGQLGQLVVTVLTTRQSDHIGDSFVGVGPSTPEVGERIVLGEGTFFWEQDEFGYHIGVRPIDNDRNYHWLNVTNIYRVHSQTVRLFFQED